MKRLLMAAALLMGAGVAGPADNQAAKIDTDPALANNVRHAIVMYGRYSIFDDVDIQAAGGTVHLTGVVDRPFKKSDIAHQECSDKAISVNGTAGLYRNRTFHFFFSRITIPQKAVGAPRRQNDI